MDKDDFHKHTADLNTTLTELKGRVAQAIKAMTEAQERRLHEAEQDLKRVPEWVELTQEEQSNVLDRLTTLALSFDRDLGGLERMIAHQFDIQSQLGDLKQRIVGEGMERRRQRVEEQKRNERQVGEEKAVRSIKISPSLSNTTQIDDLIRKLQTLRVELAYYDDFELTIEFVQKDETAE